MTPKSVAAIILGVIIFVFGISTVFGSFYTVDTSERAVVLRNGAFVKVATEGLNYKLPFIDSAIYVSNAQRTVRWDSADGHNPTMEGYSQDQQPAMLSVSVTYHIPPEESQAFYQHYQGSYDNLEGRLISRIVPTEVKTTFGKYTSISVIQDRTKFNQDILEAVRSAIKGPVVIDSVQAENIAFSDGYRKSVEQAMQARVEVQRLEQQKRQQQIQAEIVVINAKAQADSQLEVAKAQANATKLAGEAEAYAIKVKSDSLQQNPNLIELTKAEKWNGQLPSTMVPNGTIPFFNTGQIK